MSNKQKARPYQLGTSSEYLILELARVSKILELLKHYEQSGGQQLAYVILEELESSSSYMSSIAANVAALMRRRAFEEKMPGLESRAQKVLDKLIRQAEYKE